MSKLKSELSKLESRKRVKSISGWKYQKVKHNVFVERVGLGAKNKWTRKLNGKTLTVTQFGGMTVAKINNEEFFDIGFRDKGYDGKTIWTDESYAKNIEHILKNPDKLKKIAKLKGLL